MFHIRTCVLHPASETHQQLTDEQSVAAGIGSFFRWFGKCGGHYCRFGTGIFGIV